MEDESSGGSLVVWTQADLDKLEEQARRLAEHSEGWRSYTAVKYSKLILMEGEVAESLLANALREKDPRQAAVLATAGAKVSGQWREGMLPVIKRIMKELVKAENEGNGGPPE
jgi:hypothetical protein